MPQPIFYYFKDLTNNKSIFTEFAVLLLSSELTGVKSKVSAWRNVQMCPDSP